MGSVTEFPRIKEIRTFVIDGVGSGGDYHNVRAASIGRLGEFDGLIGSI